MLTISELIDSKMGKRCKPDEEELRGLPDRKALIHGRLSGFSQVKESRESVREIAAQVGKAINDGYKTKLDSITIEHWLEDIQAGVAHPGIKEDGQVIVNCLGLGISGSLAEDRRPDLKLTMDLIRKGELGAIYVTEGANRLSRDPDRVVSAMLLKLMRETNCKLRTPYEVLSPCIERDWNIIHEELEDAAKELTVMNKRLFQRKQRKAARGEFVGEPIPPGFIVRVVRQNPDGRYVFGKLMRYPPHAEVDIRILTEYVNQHGSELKTVQSLWDLRYPFFPTELAYMDKRSSLRRCPKTSTGYAITPALVRGLTTNLKLVGVWQWGDTFILNNHEPAAPEDLFLQAYELAVKKNKPKGRAVHFAPMEWDGLLQCMNGSEPRHISAHSAEGRYVCDRDYHVGQGRICLDIEGRFIDEPLVTTVLNEIELSPLAEEILAKMESDASQGKLEQARYNQQIAKAEQEVKNWEGLLQQYIAGESSTVDKEEVDFFWGCRREALEKLNELKSKPMPEAATTPADFAKVKEFLIGLRGNWHNYTPGLRNRLLKLLVDRVEIHGDYQIEATIIWKTGFQQKITIHRPQAISRRERRWRTDEDKLLRILYPSSSQEAIEAALSDRSWSGITGRALRLKLRRRRQYHAPRDWRRWTRGEDEKLKLAYEAGTSLGDIANVFNRSVNSIETRAAAKDLNRPRSARSLKRQVTWMVHNLVPLQRQSSDI